MGNFNRGRPAIVHDDPKAATRSGNEGVRAIKPVEMVRTFVLQIIIHPLAADFSHYHHLPSTIARMSALGQEQPSRHGIGANPPCSLNLVPLARSPSLAKRVVHTPPQVNSNCIDRHGGNSDDAGSQSDLEGFFRDKALPGHASIKK
jgi:hypothetical protein